MKIELAIVACLERLLARKVWGAPQMPFRAKSASLAYVPQEAVMSVAIEFDGQIPLDNEPLLDAYFAQQQALAPAIRELLLQIGAGELAAMIEPRGIEIFAYRDLASVVFAIPPAARAAFEAEFPEGLQGELLF